jgi:thymidylate synthase
MDMLMKKISDPEDLEHLHDNPMLLDSIRAELKKSLGTIGPLYGFNWRHGDLPEENHLIKILRNYPDIKDIPSDKVAAFKEAYEHYLSVKKLNNPEDPVIPEDEFIKKTYVSRVDQLGELLSELKNNPYSSRLVVNAWIPAYIPDAKFTPDMNVLLGKGALAPCHVMFQCFVQPALEEGGKMRLNLMMTQRSVDTPVGFCYNIAQYALLLELISRHVGMESNELIISTGDTHIYKDQLHLVDEQLTREPKPLPTIKFLTDETDIFKIKSEDIEIVGYDPHPHIAYPVAV